LTDAVANGLDELFEVGSELVIYRDDADLLDKITYFLAHETELAEIARAGQARTVREHTYGHRAQGILETVTATTFRRLAPIRSVTPDIRWAAKQRVLTHLHMLDALLDEAQTLGLGPWRKLRGVAPCLARRVLR
jgi:hypothetical protein